MLVPGTEGMLALGTEGVLVPGTGDRGCAARQSDSPELPPRTWRPQDWMGIEAAWGASSPLVLALIFTMDFQFRRLSCSCDGPQNVITERS